MAKPGVSLTPTSATTTIGVPVYYDQTGITYDTAYLYYDRFYSSTELSKTWPNTYDCDELPDAATPVWVKVGDATTIEISPAGYLHVVSSTGAVHYKKIDTNLSNSTGFTAEFKLKVIAGETDDYDAYVHGFSVMWIPVLISAKLQGVYFYIYSNSIRTYTDTTSQQHLMDTTDDYHTYRITYKDSIAKLYVDGVLVLTETGLYDVGAGGDPYIHFQAENNAIAGIETSWDYVYYDVTGVYIPLAQIAQGEIPTISASAEKIKTDSGSENIKLDSIQEEVKLGSKQESVTIKTIEEL